MRTSSKSLWPLAGSGKPSERKTSKPTYILSSWWVEVVVLAEEKRESDEDRKSEDSVSSMGESVALCGGLLFGGLQGVSPGSRQCLLVSVVGVYDECLSQSLSGGLL